MRVQDRAVKLCPGSDLYVPRDVLHIGTSRVRCFRRAVKLCPGSYLYVPRDVLHIGTSHVRCFRRVLSYSLSLSPGSLATTFTFNCSEFNIDERVEGLKIQKSVDRLLARSTARSLASLTRVLYIT